LGGPPLPTCRFCNLEPNQPTNRPQIDMRKWLDSKLDFGPGDLFLPLAGK
jgi:hypothetical protein